MPFVAARDLPLFSASIDCRTDRISPLSDGSGAVRRGPKDGEDASNRHEGQIQAGRRQRTEGRQMEARYSYLVFLNVANASSR